MTITELARKFNITKRTLHYYDEIGLLKPKVNANNGYREYQPKDIITLQQILIFKELHMDLSKIKSIIQSSDYDFKMVLLSQKKLLEIKRNRIDNLIKEIDNMVLSDGNVDSIEANLKETEWEMIWNEIYREQGIVQNQILKPVKIFIDTIQKKGLNKVLDLGCGTGRNAIYMANIGLHVTATDISDKGLEITAKRAKQLELSIETVKHDIRYIPFKDETFDAVLCSWVSGHGTLEDVKKHASEMLRVVKQGGMIFVDYPSIEDENYGIGREIEKNTFLDNMPAEEKIPHHYSEIKELEEIYAEYQHTITPYTYQYGQGNDIHEIKAFIVEITK